MINWAGDSSKPSHENTFLPHPSFKGGVGLGGILSGMCSSSFDVGSQIQVD